MACCGADQQKVQLCPWPGGLLRNVILKRWAYAQPPHCKCVSEQDDVPTSHCCTYQRLQHLQCSLTRVVKTTYNMRIDTWHNILTFQPWPIHLLCLLCAACRRPVLLGWCPNRNMDVATQSCINLVCIHGMTSSSKGHQASQHISKFATIVVCMSAGYTRKGFIALEGTSAGGLLVGALLNR